MIGTLSFNDSAITSKILKLLGLPILEEGETCLLLSERTDELNGYSEADRNAVMEAQGLAIIYSYGIFKELFFIYGEILKASSNNNIISK